MKENVLYGMGYITAEEIDRVGMARCRRLVFERALDDFKGKYNFLMAGMACRLNATSKVIKNSNALRLHQFLQKQTEMIK